MFALCNQLGSCPSFAMFWNNFYHLHLLQKKEIQPVNYTKWLACQVLERDTAAIHTGIPRYVTIWAQ